MEMTLSRGQWMSMRRQLATLYFPLQPFRSYFPPKRLISIHYSPILTHSLSSLPFPSFSTAATLQSSISSPLSGGKENIEIPKKGSRVLLKGMRYHELEKWVQSHGYRPAQALMLWKRLYRNNIWAHCSEELEGLNKDLKRMLSEHADFKALNFKDMVTASDGTKKDLTDTVHFGRRTSDRNRSDSLP